MTRNPVEFPVDVDDFDRVEPALQKEPFEWLKLLDALTKPTALIERGLKEVDSIQRCEMRRPRKAAVVGYKHAGLTGYPFASPARRGSGDPWPGCSTLAESEPREGNRGLETGLDESATGPDTARGRNRGPIRLRW